MSRTVRYGELLVGVEGAALFRHLLDGDDEFAQRRVDAIRGFAARLDQDPLATAMAVPELSVAEGYAAWAPIYDEMSNALIEAEEPLVDAVVRDLPPGSALDVACGTGRHAVRLAAAGHDTVGVDGSRAMLDIARAKATAARFALGDLTRLPVTDASIDLANCALALTHLADPTPAIAELARVLRPGGRVVLTDAHPTFVAIQGKALFPAGQGLAYVRNHPHGHGTYLRAFRAVGFSVVDCVEQPLVMDASTGMFAEVAEAATALYDTIPAVLLWSLVRER